jgi:hypothetical protein
VDIYIYIHISHTAPYPYARRPCYGVFLYCYTIQFSNVSNNTCLALLPTQHNSTTIILHKANCLPVILNIPQDLIFSNQDVALYKQKMRFCFTIIPSLQIKYHTTVCGAGSRPSQKVFLNKPMNFHETLCVFYTNLFLKTQAFWGCNTVTLGK